MYRRSLLFILKLSQYFPFVIDLVEYKMLSSETRWHSNDFIDMIKPPKEGKNTLINGQELKLRAITRVSHLIVSFLNCSPIQGRRENFDSDSKYIVRSRKKKNLSNNQAYCYRVTSLSFTIGVFFISFLSKFCARNTIMAKSRTARFRFGR